MNIKSTVIFDFLLKNFQKLIKFITQSYLSLLNSFLFLSRFSVSLKSLDNYFFRWFAYKLLFSRFSVLISYICGYLIIFPYPAVSHVFQGPDFLGYRFFMVQGPGSGSRFQSPGSGSKVRVRVQGQGPGPGFRSSHYFSQSSSRSWEHKVCYRILCKNMC